MKNTVPSVVRWLTWVVVVSVEAVVGFPWLSVFLAYEWLFALQPEKALFNLAAASLLLAGAYGTPLSAMVGLLLVVRYLSARTRSRTWQRYALLAGAALFIGVISRVPVNALTVVSTVVTAALALALAGGKARRRSWQKMK